MWAGRLPTKGIRVLQSSGRTTSRPVTAPMFLFSRASGSLRGQGVRQVFATPQDAVDALHSGRAALVAGALGFRPETSCALAEPDMVVRSDGPLEHPARLRSRWSTARVERRRPEPGEHLRRITHAVDEIRAGALDKVVLARAVRLAADHPIDPLAVCARLIEASPDRDGFHVDLSPAGPDHRGAVLVGSSPELLVRRVGDVVLCHPLAGSAARSTDPATDQRIARELRGSAKNAAEHRFVVEALSDSLRPWCTDLVVPETPTLACTGEMWHLGTPIRARLRDPATTALELALAVHPTPAICGTPTDRAREYILDHEEDRGFYSGCVGWCDSDGDGEWMVAIRCARIDADRLGATAWAGGGIVADSEPEEELAETVAKLRTVLTSLGVSERS